MNFAMRDTYLIRLLTAVWHKIDERHLGLIAAGVAFYTMFAIFPGMAATIAIWGAVADPLVIRDYLDQIRGMMPEAAFMILETQMNALLAAKPSSLGWATAISLLVALYSVHSGVAALISGLNAIHARRQRSGIRRIAASVALTLAMLSFFICALATVVIVPIMLNFLPLGPLQGLIVKLLPWAVMFFMIVIILGLFYRWGPNMAGARHPWLSHGALIAAVLWVAASVAFSTYLANFGSYNRVYGSIGAAVALLMWFYISAYILLLGAVLNAERDALRPDQ